MASVHRSFRLAADTADALDALAAERGLDRTALAERLLAEGLVREQHPLISFRDGDRGRVAVLAAADVEVWQVIDAVSGGEDQLDMLDLRDGEVRAALRYYDARRDEIDSLIRRNRLERARELARRQRDEELLADLRAQA